VRALFVHQNAPLPEIDLPDLKVSAQNAELTTAKFDLAVFVTDTEQGLQASVNYSTELFDASTIQRLMDHYQLLLRSIAQNPEARIHTLEFFSEDEKRLRQQQESTRIESGLRKLKVARRSEPVRLSEMGE
jgi:non-ribosomal peptide synthetase component F